jgi:hypothetical protein
VFAGECFRIGVIMERTARDRNCLPRFSILAFAQNGDIA